MKPYVKLIPIFVNISVTSLIDELHAYKSHSFLSFMLRVVNNLQVMFRGFKRNTKLSKSFKLYTFSSPTFLVAGNRKLHLTNDYLAARAVNNRYLQISERLYFKFFFIVIICVIILCFSWHCNKLAF